MEREIAGLWREVLGVDRVGVHDPFFAMGGHSLLAVQLVSRISQRYGVEVPLRDLLQATTVATQAEHVRTLRAARDQTHDALPDTGGVASHPNERYEPFPLTEVQEAYWVGRSGEFELGAVSTHSHVEIENDVEPERVGGALRILIARHEMLRAIFRPDGQQQILADVPPYAIEVIDARGMTRSAFDACVEGIRAEISHEVKPLDRWPLFEIRALRVSDTRTRYCMSFDLIVGDASSWQLVFRELGDLLGDRGAMLQPLELSFRDYVLAERALRDSPRYERSLGYWRERLADLPPAPQLPLAAKPAAIERPRFTRLTSGLQADTWRRLKVLGAEAGLSPSGLLLAAFAEVLAAWSSEPAFTINLTLFNRLPLHPQVDEIMGDFTSLNLLAVDHSGHDTFLERAQRLQRQLWSDLDHRYVGGVRVLRELARQTGSKPGAAMPVVFTSTLGLGEPGEEASVMAQLTRLGEVVHNITQTPQVWLDHQVFERDGGLAYNWDAVEGLFPAVLLQDAFEAYGRLLERLGGDQKSWQERWLDVVPLEHRQQQASINLTDRPVREATAQELFVDQVRLRPNQPAVKTPRRTLSYAELYRLSNRLGRRLSERQANRDSPIAIVMEKGWEQVVAVLGTLMAGAPYLPIDPTAPLSRLHRLLSDGKATIVLTQSCLDRTLGWPLGVERICVDQDGQLPIEDGPLETRVQSSDLAYILFTSGSTGTPKGVMIEHRSIVNRVLDVNRRFSVTADDRVFALTSLHHDLSVYDIFGSLAAGATLIFPDERTEREPGHWLEVMSRERVSVWNSVPAFMEMLLEHAQEMPESLRLVLLSGDWVPVTLPRRIASLVDGVRVIALGGPTETTVWDICQSADDVDETRPSIPYGRPMENARYFIANEKLEPRPHWAAGELYIGGIGLARGYWADEELTRARFLLHPETGERVYRSGDRGRFRPDGRIEILGRSDAQLKIRGHRIEAGEIEKRLVQHRRIRKALVVAAGERGRQHLVAYCVPSGAESPEPEDLRRFLAETLPDHMLPPNFVALDEIPLTSNGKLDRSRLPECAAGAPAEANGDEGLETELASRIARHVAGVLGIERLGSREDWLALGATSVDMVRISNLLDGDLGYRPKIDDLYRQPTAERIATLCEDQRRERDGADASSVALQFWGNNPLSKRYQPIVDPAARDAFTRSQTGLRGITERASWVSLETDEIRRAQTTKPGSVELTAISLFARSPVSGSTSCSATYGKTSKWDDRSTVIHRRAVSTRCRPTLTSSRVA